MSGWTLSAAEKAVEDGHVTVREAVVLTGRALLVQAVERVKVLWDIGGEHEACALDVLRHVLREYDRLTGTTDSAPLDDVYEKMLVMGRANRRQHKDGTTDRSEGE